MRAVTAETQTWLAIRQILLDRCDDFHLQFRIVRKTFEPEAIHDLRVSSRRLREVLALWAECFDKQQAVPVCRELKRFTKKLGTIRNYDEAIAFFETLATMYPLGDSSISTILSMLRYERAAEKRLLLRALKENDLSHLFAAVDSLCKGSSIFNPACPSLLKPFKETLLASFDGIERTITRLLPEALVEENIIDQHRLRIAIKRLRYRFEFTASFAKADYKTVYSTIKEYQEFLGQMHDLDVFTALLPIEDTMPNGTRPLGEIINNRRTTIFNRFVRLNESAPLEQTADQIRGLI